jgi:hypothetical protein
MPEQCDGHVIPRSDLAPHKPYAAKGQSEFAAPRIQAPSRAVPFNFNNSWRNLGFPLSIATAVACPEAFCLDVIAGSRNWNHISIDCLDEGCRCASYDGATAE